MSTDQAKIIISEFDRLGMELSDGLNWLTDHGKISDCVVFFGDVASADAERAIRFLKEQPSPCPQKP